MPFRDLPSFVDAVLKAARQLDPHHVLFLTYEPVTLGPAWELHPFKRWLVLRTDDPADALRAVACSLLARSAWLGKGPTTAVPARLRARFAETEKRLCDQLSLTGGRFSTAPFSAAERLVRHSVVFPGLAPVYVKAKNAQDALERALAKARTWRPDLAPSLDRQAARVDVCE